MIMDRRNHAETYKFFYQDAATLQLLTLCSDNKDPTWPHMHIRVDALTSSTQKLKLLGEVRQSTYTLQHPHSRALREKGTHVEINRWRHKLTLYEDSSRDL
jgi:hypothetical protein